MTLFYLLMLSFLFVHELDAVHKHEWRVLPLTSFLPDEIGRRVFVVAHVPLFFAIFYFGELNPISGVATGLSIFAIIHVGLHWLFRKHPAYEFNTVLSWGLICGAGLFGALHLATLPMF